MAQSTSFTALQTPFVDLRTGMVTATWLQVIRIWQQQLAKGFDSNGTLISNLDPGISIVGREGTLGTILQYLSADGVLSGAGMATATDSIQGAVILPDGATSNKLGSAASASTGAFDPAGAAAAAQASAEAHADAAANTAQNNAQAFAANAIATAFAPGITVTITTAALTSTGTQGSMTFTDGLLTAQTPAT